MNHRRRNYLLAGLAVVLVLSVSWDLLLTVACDIAYPAALSWGLRGQIESVEIQPNTDWPKQRITDPTQIAALQSWLFATHEDSSVRSAPPPAVCEMQLVFQDGRVERIPHSPFRLPQTSDGCSDVRDHIRFRWNGFVRSGSAQQLSAILGP